MSKEQVEAVLKSLEVKGLMRQTSEGLWEPTDLGRLVAHNTGGRN